MPQPWERDQVVPQWQLDQQVATQRQGERGISAAAAPTMPERLARSVVKGAATTLDVAGGLAPLVAKGAAPNLGMAGLGAAMGAPLGPPGMLGGAMIGGYALPAADMLISGFNAATGRNMGSSSQKYSELLEALGAPAARNTAERAAEGVGAAVGGVATGAPAAAGMAALRGAQALPRVSRGVMQALGNRPAAQAGAAATSAAAGQYATETTGSPYAGLAASLAAPLAVPAGIAAGRRAITPFPSQLRGNEPNLVAAAQRERIPLTPGQQTGNPTLRRTEDVLATLPFSSEMAGNTIDAQRTAFNRAILERAGINDDRAIPEVLDRAHGDWGREYNNTLQQIPVLFADRPFLGDLRSAGRGVEQNGRGVFDDQLRAVEDLARNTSAPLDPRRVAAIRSDIGDRARATSDGSLRNGLRELQDALDGLVERQANSAVADDIRDLRRRYAALVVVEDAMAGGTQIDRAQGNVPFGSFRSAVSGGDRRAFARGRGQYNELARVGDYLATRTPNSGTAERTAIKDLLTFETPSAVVGGFAGGAPGAAAAVAASLAARFGVPPAIQWGMQTAPGRAYVTNQLFAEPLQMQPSFLGGARGAVSSPTDENWLIQEQRRLALARALAPQAGAR